MAATVIDYIAGKGVDKKIFSAAGYGGECRSTELIQIFQTNI